MLVPKGLSLLNISSAFQAYFPSKAAASRASRRYLVSGNHDTKFLVLIAYNLVIIRLFFSFTYIF